MDNPRFYHKFDSILLFFTGRAAEVLAKKPIDFEKTVLTKKIGRTTQKK
jgi:hypothetical protein